MKQLTILIVVIIAYSASISAIKRPNATKQPDAKKRPNIVVILSDDVGFEEYGMFGIREGASNTPNIDKLSQKGVAFKTTYAQSICVPSRAVFISGNYGVNTGSYDNSLSYLPNVRGRINRDKERLPLFTKVAKDAGYKVAIAGKWHHILGGWIPDDKDILGVDTYCMWNGSKRGYERVLDTILSYEPTWEAKNLLPRYWKPMYIQNGKLLKTKLEDYGPDILSDFICDFMEQEADSEKPFLAYYTMALAHGVHCPTPRDTLNGDTPNNNDYKWSTKKGQHYFRSQIRYMDELIKKINDKAHELGIADNTIFIYTSDNGTVSLAKSRRVEYGVHVPLVIWGAGIEQRGLTDELTDFTDILPTIADFAGITVDKPYDGKSLKPFLIGEKDETKEVIYSFPGISRLVRTKDFMLEAVCPLYGYPKGRFYKTNGSCDGRGYENITDNPKYIKERAMFDSLLNVYPATLPESFDDPIWKLGHMNRGYKVFTGKRKRNNHLVLPTLYKFYDESFGSN